MDVAAQNASLDNDYGTSHGTNAPASFLLALFAGDPRSLSGLELADETEIDDLVLGPTLVANGYERVAVAHADFLDSVDGVKSTDGPVTFPDPLEAWSNTATHWQLLAVDGTTRWDSGPIAGGLTVTGAGDGPTVVLSIFYADSAI